MRNIRVFKRIIIDLLAIIGVLAVFLYSSGNIVVSFVEDVPPTVEERTALQDATSNRVSQDELLNTLEFQVIGIAMSDVRMWGAGDTPVIELDVKVTNVGRSDVESSVVTCIIWDTNDTELGWQKADIVYGSTIDNGIPSETSIYTNFHIAGTAEDVSRVSFIVNNVIFK